MAKIVNITKTQNYLGKKYIRSRDLLCRSIGLLVLDNPHASSALVEPWFFRVIGSFYFLL
jgi:hypothetical protein